MKNNPASLIGHLPRPPLKSRHIRRLLPAAGAVLVLILLGWLLANDGFLYGQTAARVTAVTTEKGGSGGTPVAQTVTAVLTGGSHRGARVTLANTFTANGTDGVRLAPGDRIFVTVSQSGSRLAVQFAGYKYDSLLFVFFAGFALLLLLVGGRQGLLALVSAAFNTGLFLLVVRLYVKGGSFLLPAAAAAVLSAVTSILLVTGFGRRAAAALLSSLISASFAVLLTALALWATGSRGMHYDQMEVLTRSPREVFLAQVLVGTLGGIMDIAVTMTSAVQELLERVPDISLRELWRSGMAIGQDMLSTMTGTMLFAYLSGSMPLVLLELDSGYAFPTIIRINLSLETVRLLAGCLGIVAAIPLSLAVAMRLLPRGRRAGKAVGP